MRAPGGADADFREASSPYSLIDRYWEEAGGDFHRRLLFTYLRTYLMDQVMAKVDRASMANSLEARSPFLDVDLVDLVMGFPYEFKYRHLAGKRILRHLMQGSLPASVTARRKKGFGVPIGAGCASEMRPLCEDTLSPAKIKAERHFRSCLCRAAEAGAFHRAGRSPQEAVDAAGLHALARSLVRRPARSLSRAGRRRPPERTARMAVLDAPRASASWLARAAAILVLWAVIELGLLMAGVSPVLQGDLGDSDAYLQLVKVERLHDTADWYDNLLPRSNWPQGEPVAWSRSLDAVLLAGATLFRPFFANFHDALFWFGVVLSPLCALACAFAAGWMPGPLLNPSARFGAALLFLTQPGILSYTYARGPNHHGILFLAFIAACGFILRALKDPEARHAAGWAGAMIGIGLWISVEFLLPLAIVLTVLGHCGCGRAIAGPRPTGSFAAGLFISLVRPAAGRTRACRSASHRNTIGCRSFIFCWLESCSHFGSSCRLPRGATAAWPPPRRL